MVGLAEVLKGRGAQVTGSDTDETFYTDNILKELSIPYAEGFSKDNLEDDTRVVVHSAAYSVPDNPELLEVKSKNIPIVTYPEMLGLLSRNVDASGVSGTHGKSTTTAITGTILKFLEMPVTVINGAAVFTFDNHSSLVRGRRYLVAETCEYRRHFLHYRPQRIVITCIEKEHLDYFRDEADVFCAFESFGNNVSRGGEVVFNADDPGVLMVIKRLREKRSDLTFIAYGTHAQGDYRIVDIEEKAGLTDFRLSGFTEDFTLKIPGEHSVWNATAAIALSRLILNKEKGFNEANCAVRIRAAIEQFAGCLRRSEVVGEAAGILFCDDYGHHPTEIAKTLRGFSRFYPARRLIVDFMPHLYTRTQILLKEFGSCFSQAHMVVLHGIYESAREKHQRLVDGKDLYHEVVKNRAVVHYFERVMDAAPFLIENLRKGDLFLTMGAGDNWKLGRYLLDSYKGNHT